MAIHPGNHFGLYEVLSAIDADGMGEVYRERDAKPGPNDRIAVQGNETNQEK